ncbi:MerR family transcriptional regulator [Fredinandcohnia humi]
MTNFPNDPDNTLLDYELLNKLVVGIGEVSEITGVPTRKLRYWEQKGIIKSENDIDGSTRKYNYLNIKKIILIKELLEDGFTLEAAAKKVEDRMKNLNDLFNRLSKVKD